MKAVIITLLLMIIGVVSVDRRGPRHRGRRPALRAHAHEQRVHRGRPARGSRRGGRHRLGGAVPRWLHRCRRVRRRDRPGARPNGQHW